MTHPRNAQPAGADAEKAAFLRDLRALRDQAGLQTSDLAARAHYPEGTLQAVEDGPALPSLPVLEAYVRGCGARPSDWEERWRRLTAMPAAELGSALPTRAPSANRLPTRAGSAGPVGLSATEKAALAPGLARVAAGLGPTTVATDTGSWFARPDMVTTDAGSPTGSSVPPEAPPAGPDSGAPWQAPDPGTAWPSAGGGAARPPAQPAAARPFTERGGARPFADGRTGQPESGTAWPPADRAPARPAARNGAPWPGAAADRGPSWPKAAGSGGPASAGPAPGGSASGGSAFGGAASSGAAFGGAAGSSTQRGPAAAGGTGDRGRTGNTAPLNASEIPPRTGATGRPAGRTVALVVLSVVALLIVAALLWLALKP